MLDVYFFFFKQKTAYEMRISDWSSDVCSSDLREHTQPIGVVRLDGDAKGSVADGAGDRADHEAFQLGQKIRLHNEGRARLAVVTLQRNRDNIASLHCQPSTCAAASSTNRSASSSAGSPF